MSGMKKSTETKWTMLISVRIDKSLLQKIDEKLAEVNKNRIRPLSRSWMIKEILDKGV